MKTTPCNHAEHSTPRTAPANPRLVAALAMARLGYCVHPLASNGKIPILTGWPQVATTDAEQIAAWWNEYPAANIGIVVPSGTVILDVDRRHGGEKSLAALEAEHGELPISWQVETPNGYHVYLTTPEDTSRAIGCRPGLDLLTAGSNVVAPGSVRDGHTYTWTDCHRPTDMTPAPAPGWLVTLADRPAPTPRRQARGTPCDKLKARALNLSQLPLPLPPGEAAALLRREDVARQVAAFLGVVAPLGTNCPCPLPGHGPDRHPSARLMPPVGDRDGWKLFCGHTGRAWPLPNVFFARITGELPSALPAPSLAVWTVRLLLAAGVLQAPEIAAPALRGGGQAVRTAYAGFLDLLRCRRVLGSKTAPYSYRFAAAWCGLTLRQAERGIKALLRNGYLRIATTFKGLTIFAAGTLDTIIARVMARRPKPTPRQVAPAEAPPIDTGPGPIWPGAVWPLAEAPERGGGP